MTTRRRVTAPRTEKRAGPRVAIAVPVVVSLYGVQQPVLAESLDIGVGGLCVQTPLPFSKNDITVVAIEIADSQLRIKAQGVWQRDTLTEHTVLTGIQFLDVTPEVQSILWRVLQARIQELTAFLAEVSDLCPIALDEAMDLTMRTRRRLFPSGRYIYHHGMRDEFEGSIFIVASGEVALEVATPCEERIQLDRVREGGVFGGLPVIAGLEHADSAIPMEDVQVLEIDRYSYGELLREKPLVARALDRAVVRRYLNHISALLDKGLFA